MKVVIFGGLGYLGKNLSYELKKKKYQVYIFSNKKFNKNSNKALTYQVERFEECLLKIKPKIIFFLSGNSNPNTSINHVYDIERSNIPLQHFLESIKNIKYKGKVFYSSSIAVYGNKSSFLPSKEDGILKPGNYYGLSKLIAENQINFYRKNHKLNIVILRLASFFGPGLKKQFIYEFTKKAQNSKKIILHGHKDDSRELISIDYLVKIILKLTKKKIISEDINIGSGKQIKISKLADKILKITKIQKSYLFTNKVKSPNFPVMSRKKLSKIIKLNKIKLNFDNDLKKTVLSYIHER